MHDITHCEQRSLSRIESDIYDEGEETEDELLWKRTHPTHSSFLYFKLVISVLLQLMYSLPGDTDALLFGAV